MTIDSSYFPETYVADVDDLFYSWTFESIGADTIGVTLTLTDGTVINPVSTDYMLRLGGFGPLFQRGELEVTVSGGYPDAVAINFNRNTPITQELQLVQGEPFPAEAYEAAGDKLTLICQELKGELCDCPWGGTVDDPNRPSPPPSELPECQPYSCEAYEAYLGDTDLDLYKNYTVLTTGTIPWPFATALDQGQLLKLCPNWIAGPIGIYTDYTGNPGVNGGPAVAITDLVLDADSSPDFCGGVIDRCCCIDFDGNLPTAMLRKMENPDSGVLESGDLQVEMIISGYNGGTTLSAGGGAADGDLIYGTDRRYRFTYDGNTATYYDPGEVRVKAQSINVNDVRVTLFIAEGSSGYVGGGDATTEFVVPNVADKWHLVIAKVSATAPYEHPRDNGRYGVARDVTINITYAGESQTLTNMQGYAVSSPTSPKGIQNLQEANLILYGHAKLFKDAICSIAYIAVGRTESQASGQAQIAYDRNFLDYTPPGYC